jgi:hypothetical protein
LCPPDYNRDREELNQNAHHVMLGFWLDVVEHKTGNYASAAQTEHLAELRRGNLVFMPRFWVDCGATVRKRISISEGLLGPAH